MRPKNKIVLYYPPPEPYARNCPPLPMLALARMFEPSRFDVCPINGTTDNEPEKMVIKEISEGNTICAALTCMTGHQIYEALKIARLIRKVNPNLPLVWGGVHPSIEPQTTIKDECVDYVVRGQGESTFRELVECLINKGSPENIKGLTFKSNGNILSTPDRFLDDINLFPPFPWDLVDVRKIIRRDAHWGEYFDYYTSQGCPFDCTFCSEPMFSKRRYTALSPERLVSELEMLTKRYGVRTFRFVDSEFFIRKKDTLEFCENIVKRKLDIQLIGLNGRIDSLLSFDERTWNLFYRAGIRQMLIGAESGDQLVLSILRKRIKVEDTFRLFEIASKHHIALFVSLMTGVPGVDNQREFSATIELLDKMLKKDYTSVYNAFIFHYTPYPGSALYGEAIRHGFKPPSTLEGWADFNLFNTRIPWVKKAQKTRAMFITRYILARFTGRERPQNPIIRFLHTLIYKPIDAIFRWRWKHRFFDHSWLERKFIDTINGCIPLFRGGYLRELKRRWIVSRKSNLKIHYKNNK
ncbi:MAG: hypothetical protein A2W23_07080 [Planctomycetes bacterium RBG_16_43_13]|nr:MAG: hypothetical protein A2W23_07080 [Planctomycetes bacterium RBG_16_43_13]